MFVFKIQENDYDTVLMCLSNHIPKIYDESISLEDEIVINKNNYGSGSKMIIDEPKMPPTSAGLILANATASLLASTTAVAASSVIGIDENREQARQEIANSQGSSSQENNHYHERHNSNNSSQENRKQRQITLPLLIPDNTEYCIAGLYCTKTFSLIIPTLMEIMFYETE